MENGIQKSILCMIDLSESSTRTLQIAAKNAFENHRDLVVLYPYRLKNQQVGEQRATLKQRLEKEAHERFEKLKVSVNELSRVPYVFSAEVGFETDRLEAHLQSQPVDSVYVCKSIANQAEINSDWGEFVKRLHVPVVLIP
jgi:hypothetical protein